MIAVLMICNGYWNTDKWKVALPRSALLSTDALFSVPGTRERPNGYGHRYHDNRYRGMWRSGALYATPTSTRPRPMSHITRQVITLQRWPPISQGKLSPCNTGSKRPFVNASPIATLLLDGKNPKMRAKPLCNVFVLQITQ